MEHSRNSSFKSTTWASVTLNTIKQTPIWKQYQDLNGSVPKDKYQNILTAAMIQLGYDNKGKNSFHKRPEKVMVRCSKNNLKGIYTEVYDFPVVPNHLLENFYLVTGLVNFNMEENTEETNLAEYGLEHYENAGRNQAKKQSREDFVNELAMKSYNNDNEFFEC